MWHMLSALPGFFLPFFFFPGSELLGFLKGWITVLCSSLTTPFSERMLPESLSQCQIVRCCVKSVSTIGSWVDIYIYIYKMFKEIPVQ